MLFRLLKPALFALDSETGHRLAINGLKALPLRGPMPVPGWGMTSPPRRRSRPMVRAPGWICACPAAPPPPAGTPRAQVSFGPISWLIVGEVFPLQVPHCRPRA